MCPGPIESKHVHSLTCQVQKMLCMLICLQPLTLVCPWVWQVPWSCAVGDMHRRAAAPASAKAPQVMARQGCSSILQNLVHKAGVLVDCNTRVEDNIFFPLDLDQAQQT